MLKRPHSFVWMLLALLLSVQPLVPTAAYAEAQMRCAGVAVSSRPCARLLLPASGLTAPATYTALMTCCHMARSGCTMHQGCPAMHGAQIAGMSPRRAALSSPHCLVTIRMASASCTYLAPQRAKWLLAAAPALAPPAAPILFDRFPAIIDAQVCSRPAVFLSLLLPRLHGLRAPPAA